MIRRHPIVEHKHKRSPLGHASSVRRATPDSRIRVWNADDPKAREEEAFCNLSRTRQMELMIDAWVTRHRTANDPDVMAEAGRQAVARHMAEAAMSHMQIIEGPDPRIVVRPAKAMFGALKDAFAIQYANAGKVVTDPKFPRKAPWWRFVKDMRKRTEDI